MEAPKAGQRLRCATCGTEIVVVKAPSEPIVCCGAGLSPREAAAPATEAKSDG
jgi:hypothetical protein